MHRLATPLLLKPVGIAIAILAAMAFSPSRAAAECGDYVHIEKKTTTDADIPNSGHKPCNGPTCSSKPATPVAPISVPATDSESTKQVSSLADRGLDSLGTQERIALQARLKLPTALPSSIFHPPRAI